MARHYITDRRSLRDPASLVDTIAAAFTAGIEVVQIREKDLEGRELAGLVSAAVACKGEGRVIVNGRLDVALACGADGVHLPANSAAPESLRELCPEGFLIGVSCHSLEEVLQAEREGADYVYLSPIFASPGKGSPLGADLLRIVKERTRVHVVALGGVTEENQELCWGAGADGVAAIRWFQERFEPRK